MVELQTYQNDLLKELDTGQGLRPDTVKNFAEPQSFLFGLPNSPLHLPFYGSHRSYGEGPVAEFVGD